MLAGTSPKELLAKMKKVADCVQHALARAACRRAAIERTSLRRHKKCAATPVVDPDLVGSLYTQGEDLVPHGVLCVFMNGSRRSSGDASSL